MTLFLNVNYSEKDEAKAKGAKWNAELKKWYVKARCDYPKFKKWILKDEEDEVEIIFDYFYIIEGKRNCFKCGKETIVIGFGLENYYHIEFDRETFYSGEINIASEIEALSPEVLEYLKNKYHFYLDYSKTTKSKYYANHCSHCNVLQGNFPLFGEVDSPFCVDSIEKAKELKLIKVFIKNDLVTYASIGYGSEDHWIKEYGKIHVIDIDFNM